MAVTIAEYLGQRTDSEIPIPPCQVPPVTLSSVPKCPFNNQPCAKIMKGSSQFSEEDSESGGRQSKHPVCSLRKSDGTFYIVCEDRLISASTSQISEYQRDMLLQVSKVLFNQDIEFSQVGYKSEVKIQTGETEKQRHRADFILAVIDNSVEAFGPRRILVEVQGGGETNNTGRISRHIEQWSQLAEPNNSFLRQNIGKAGTIETNAWRRFQEQLFAKATTAQKSGCGFAVVLGKVVFDYMVSVIPNIHSIKLDPTNSGWDTAFVTYREKVTIGNTNSSSGAVELEIDPHRTIYTKLDSLFKLLTQRGKVNIVPFTGEFTGLNGKKIVVSESGTANPT